MKNSQSSGLTINALKYLALIAMFLDHFAIVFFPGSWVYFYLRFFGRLAGPLFLFAAVQGYHHTKNFPRYLKRLFIFALLSQIPYVYFNAGGNFAHAQWWDLNVIFTFFLGQLALLVRHTQLNLTYRLGLLGVILVVSSFANWGIIGILIMLVYDYFYSKPRPYALWVYLLLVATYFNLWSLPTDPLLALARTGQLAIDPDQAWTSLIYSGTIIPGVLIYRFYRGAKGSPNPWHRWAFYLFYPLHHLLLGYLATLI